jgi:hypothetical protein
VRPEAQAEIDRLRKLLALVIRRLIEHDPDAADLLDQLQPSDMPDDSTNDIG